VFRRAVINDGVAVYKNLVSRFLRGRAPPEQHAIPNKLMGIKRGRDSFTTGMEDTYEQAVAADCAVSDNLLKGLHCQLPP